jgi:Na+/proline symporter
MCVLCIVLISTTIYHVGGFSGLEEGLANSHPEMINIIEPGDNPTVPWYGIIGACLFGFFIMFSQPYIAARYLALPNISRKSVGLFSIISLLTGFLFSLMFVMGPAGRLLFPNAEADYMSVTLATNMLPPLLSGVMMIGFFSAILSTATSILLVIGQGIGRDVYAQISKKATPKKQIRVTQITTLIAVLCVLLFNYVSPPPFLQVFVYLGLTGIGSAICMPFFGGVLWKKASKEGAFASAIAGPAGYLVHVQLLGQSWYWGMGIAVIWAAIAFFVVTWIRNAVKGFDPELEKLADPLTD